MNLLSIAVEGRPAWIHRLSGKLTGLKANGVNYTCFLRRSPRTPRVKLSSHEHHGPLNYHDPRRAGSLSFDYFCAEDKSQTWHQRDLKGLQINKSIPQVKTYTKQVLFPFLVTLELRGMLRPISAQVGTHVALHYKSILQYSVETAPYCKVTELCWSVPFTLVLEM